MLVLVLNCGSSSLKFQLLDMVGEVAIAKGVVERIGLPEGNFKYTAKDKSVEVKEEFLSHSDALKAVLDMLVNAKLGVISDVSSINAIGHRVAHGGELFTSAAIITQEVLSGIKSCIHLAPLHNPANIVGIEECLKLMHGVPQVAVFDTAFHQTMPEDSYLYPLPYDYYKQYKIRRYGFHGSSHRYVADKAAQILGESIDKLKIVSCHLGNGASVCAIDGGKSIDISMGLTPLAGIPMGTRTGDIDPAIIQFLMEKEKLSIDEVMDILNKKSGVLGVSGVSSDFRDIENNAAQGIKQCQLALDIFSRAVKKYIGSYFAVLNKLDVLIFTAGIGENSPEVRKKICRGLENMGIKVDSKKNNTVKQGIISLPESKVKVMIIPTNEELMIARDTLKLTFN